MKLKENLIEKFGKEINHMSCIYLNDGEKWLRHCLDKVKPKNVIEIGTYQGVSTAIIAEYAKEVYAFDFEDKPLRPKIWDYLKINNIDYTIIKNRDDEIEKVNNIFNNTKIDLTFLDGEHFNGELEKDYDMVKKSKNILIHDYAKDFKEVYDFCNNVKGWEKEIYGSFCLLIKKKIRVRKNKY